MAVTGSGGGAGAWTTTAGSDGATFGFLGAEIGENGEGLPEVVNRRAHPLGGTVGLRVGDVITGFNGGPISALAGLKMKYEAAAAGTRIVLKVRRASEIVEVSFVKQAS
jgi:C-terminal processing protease CtpA/Prc